MREEPRTPATGGPSGARKETRGTTLDRYLRARGALSPLVAARIGCELVRALAGDLSSSAKGRPAPVEPSRIVVTAGGSVRVLPGAKGSGRPAAATSPLYASPEEALGGKGDYRSQFYSLGCVLFEILTGRPPFRADGPKATLRAHLRDAIPDPRSEVPEVPEELARTVKELLFKDPEFRLQDARALLARLRNAASNGDPRSRAPAPSPRPSAPDRRPAGVTAEPSSSRKRASASRGGPTRSSRKSSPPSGGPAPKGSRLSEKSATGRARAPGSGTTRRTVPGDTGDVLALSARTRSRGGKGWIFTVVGGLLGVIASVLVGVLVAEDSAGKRRKAESERNTQLAERLEARKEAFRAAIDEEAEVVANASKKAVEVTSDPAMSLSLKRDRIASIINSVCTLPGAIEITAIFDALPEEETEASPETDEAYQKIVESIKSLRAEGRLGDALAKIREAERAHPEREGELDPLIAEISEKLETLWKADVETIRTRISERRLAEAQTVIEKALEYGDNQIRLEASAYQKQIERREAASAGESAGPPPPDDVEDDFENLLEEFERGEG